MENTLKYLLLQIMLMAECCLLFVGWSYIGSEFVDSSTRLYHSVPEYL